MNDNRFIPDPPDPDVFIANQNKWALEQLAPYVGQHVAWSFDGASILASGPDLDALEENMKAAGIDPQRVVIGYVDDPNFSQI
jgi:hypothetical protein